MRLTEFSYLNSAWIILGATAFYGWVHSWLASHQTKLLARRILGASFTDRYYRLGYNLFAVVSLLPVMAIVAVLPDRQLYAFGSPLALMLFALQGAAVVFVFIGILQRDLLEFFGLRQLVEETPVQSEELFVKGLYRWVRHPLYTAGFVLMWATPVMTVNLLVFYLGLSLYLVIGAYYEERKLLQEFGEAYRRYQKAVPMFLPAPPRGKFGV